LNCDENSKRWKDMLANKYEEGTAILRFKGDLASLNTVMRDPSLARILKTNHYRQKNKYVVWPSYDLAVTFMDGTEGITHSMRTKEYELRDELYFELFKLLGYGKPELIEFSRLQIKNAPISKRLLTPLVKEKKVMGWDDPRLPTLKGLARRGILPEAIRTFVLSFGLSKVESEPGWEALLVENKKLIEPVAKHYFFVADPVKITIKNAPAKKVTLKSHPKNESLGSREVEVGDTLLIPKKDFDAIAEGETFRLKDLYNVKLIKKGKSATCEFAGDVGMVEKKLQWVTPNNIKCKVLIPKDLVDDNGNYQENSLEIAKGVCETACANINEGELIQFERFGFCKLDKKSGKKVIFIYSC
jgi:glutamyl-tRNA synthetase